MKKILGIIVLFFTIAAFTLQQFDNKPKLLIKELQKLAPQTPLVFEAMNIPDSLQTHSKHRWYNIKAYDSIVYYVYVGRVNSCRASGCSSPAVKGAESYEYFDYFIVFSNNVQIEMVRVYNYASTHGQAIVSKPWLKQFIGYTPPAPLEVGKQIDAISGATISVYALTHDVEMQSIALQNIVKN